MLSKFRRFLEKKQKTIVNKKPSWQRRRVNLNCEVLEDRAVPAISITNPATAYTQDFNTLITTGVNQTWTNDSTLTGWSLFNKTPAAITTYNADSGTSSTGSFNSFGTGTSTDRALGGTASGGTYFGSPGSGTVAGWIATDFVNNTGTSISNVTVTFDGEQWRDGGNTTAQSMVMEYGFGATFTSVSTWTAAGALFNWTSPVHTSTAAAVDGNNAGKVPGVGGTLSLSSSWADGTHLWIRWIENNDAGNDHGLAIDNFSFTGSAAGDTVSIASTDANKFEGNSGSTPFTFTVTRTGSGNSSVDWAVTGSGANSADATDFAGGVFPSGTVNFTGSQTQQVVTINVNGDTTFEPSDGFTVTLSNSTPGWTISAATAIGTIQNDEAPTSPAGDVAIIGYNTNGSPDSFTIVLMRDYLAGQTFFVNDNEVASPGGTSFSDLAEGEAQFTAPMAC